MHERGAELIRSAFGRARESGSPTWGRMTNAVLKNRLLDLTDREFSEAEWGAQSFRDFVEQFGDVVEPVPGAYPPEVSLRGDAIPSGDRSAGSQAPDLGAGRHIRSDLWTSVLDYSSGRRYRWDGEHAIPYEADEACEGKLLPTLTEEEFRSWRQEFVQEQSSENSDRASLLYGWFEREEPLSYLPRSLRIPWVIELKRRVLTRLSEWFESEGIPTPDDIVASNRPEKKAEADVLRSQVLEAVRVMNRDELESLKLPATVLLRGRNRNF
jgi:hypothetical protein